MFENVPNNLPVQPAAGAPSPAPRKEPEDMFAGVDTGGAVPPSKAPAMPPPPASSGGGRRRVIGVAVVVALVLIWGAAGAWWFFFRTKSEAPVVATDTSTQMKDEAPIVEAPPVQEAAPVTPPVAATATTTDTAMIPAPDTISTSTTPSSSASGTDAIVPPTVAPTAPPSVPPPTAALALPTGKDSDGDGLTDVEEDTLGTKASLADTDGDGYKDLAELTSGYDPTRPAAKISASPAFHQVTIGDGWKVYLPTKWTLGSDTTVAGDYLIQTSTPTNFSVHIAVKPQALTFFAWLAANEPTVDSSSLKQLTTKAGYPAWQTADRLTTYIISENAIVVVRYQATAAKSDDFRTTYDYVVQTLTAR